MPAPPNINLDDPTIVAIATPAGRGGIGVVRLSGPRAQAIGSALVQTSTAVRPREAHYGLLVEDNGDRIDDAVLTFFAAPKSYTGEDVVEIASHGSPVVLDWIVRSAVARGATPARAGEFTERAFLNGRLDLTQAEAVRDLIESQTLAQAKLAAQQMGGSIAEHMRPAKAMLIGLIARLEAGIDFAEDDIDTTPDAEIRLLVEQILPSLVSLLKSFDRGRMMRQGLKLAIVGRPNVGKSSLFNRLVERERAIVTASPGTTRDVISETIALGGIPVELMDTAGVRDAEDEAERMGVRRSLQAAADADVVLLVLDASAAGETDTVQELQDQLLNRPVIVALNKIDIADASRAFDIPSEQNWAQVETSARTDEGIAALKAAILHVAQAGGGEPGEATLTTLRQHDAVQRAYDALARAHAAAEEHIPHEMLLLDLYESLRAIDELTGETTTDDLLNLIFSSFCIGK